MFPEKVIVCSVCGQSCLGRHVAKYCDHCRREVLKAAARDSYYRKKKNLIREIGAIDKCKRCQKEYIVTGPTQRYCLDCKPIIKQEHKISFCEREIKKDPVAFILKRRKQELATINKKREIYRQKNTEWNIKKRRMVGVREIGSFDSCQRCKIQYTVTNPRHKYCLACHLEYDKIWKQQKREESGVRKIGSLDFCQVCKAQYVVKTPRHKYCLICMTYKGRKENRIKFGEPDHD